jgi:hypothetical protein
MRRVAVIAARRLSMRDLELITAVNAREGKRVGGIRVRRLSPRPAVGEVSRSSSLGKI